jgi:hypothetical protein
LFSFASAAALSKRGAACLKTSAILACYGRAANQSMRGFMLRGVERERLAGFSVDLSSFANLSTMYLAFVKSVLAFERYTEVEAVAAQTNASTAAADEKRMRTVYLEWLSG